MKYRKVGAVTVIVIAVIIIYAVVTLSDLRGRIAQAQSERAGLEQQIADADAANAELRHSIENSEDDEVIEGIARDKLGLVMPGERVFTKD